MTRHRLLFLGTWLAGFVALLLMPGFEARRLLQGMILGWWIFLFWEPEWSQMSLMLCAVVLLSGLTVGAAAWAMDRAKLRKVAWLILLGAVIGGAALGYASTSGDFESWTTSPPIDAAVESNRYDPSRGDFRGVVVFPAMLTNAMWGLYGATWICFLWALRIRLEGVRPPATRA